MEIQGQDDGGSETVVLREGGSKKELGRGVFCSSDPKDRFVSRRHVSLQLQPQPDEEGMSPSLSVRFQVIGRNPIWVFDHSTEEIQVFRRSEIGKLEAGDKLCLSSKRPVWLGLKRMKTNDLSERLEGGYGQMKKSVDDLELESVDISEIDAVKEFGFLVLGHEFDQFPKKMVCTPDNWNWFLEESKGKSEDDEGDEDEDVDEEDDDDNEDEEDEDGDDEEEEEEEEDEEEEEEEEEDEAMEE